MIRKVGFQRWAYALPLCCASVKERQTLYIDSQIGDNFKSFLATETGFGSVGLSEGQPFVEMKMGSLAVERINVGGKEVEWRSA